MSNKHKVCEYFFIHLPCSSKIKILIYSSSMLLSCDSKAAMLKECAGGGVNSRRMRGRECDDEEQQVGGVGSQSRRMRGREKTILSPVCSRQEIY
jgi:hypothetical protein